jgi:hypothetical protein
MVAYFKSATEYVMMPREKDLFWRGIADFYPYSSKPATGLNLTLNHLQ